MAPAGGLSGELLPQRGGLLCESILAPVEIYLFLQVASSEETPVLSNRLIVSAPPHTPHPPPAGVVKRLRDERDNAGQVLLNHSSFLAPLD